MPTEDELLVQYLGGRDVPCPGCGYNVRDLREPRCPECGDRLVLSLALAEPRLGYFLGGLIPLAMGAGFGVFTGAWGYSQIGLELEIVTLLAGAAVLGSLLFGWIRGRSRIRRAGRMARSLALAGCSAAVVAFVVVFFLTL
ncbi:MAG: hypothetical protein FJ255_10215 [Phycisphaerae bacterium]|nr:hypothetical protein [Phycisphaerae bacterium]